MGFSIARTALLALSLGLLGFLASAHPVAATAPAVASVILLALPSMRELLRACGTRRGLAALAAFSAYALVIESVGIATGFPYGRFSYGDGLGPKAFGLAPLIVGFAWVPILLAGFFLAARIRTASTAARIAVGALAMVAIDAVLDPGAVRAGYWGWETPGAYYGVPLVNFAGWLLTSGIAMAAALKVLPPVPHPRLALSALLTLSFWTGYAAFSRLAPPVALGLLLVAVLFDEMRRARA